MNEKINKTLSKPYSSLPPLLRGNKLRLKASKIRDEIQYFINFSDENNKRMSMEDVVDGLFCIKSILENNLYDIRDVIKDNEEIIKKNKIKD